MSDLNDLTNAVMALIDESDVEECVKQAVLEKCLQLVASTINTNTRPVEADPSAQRGWDSIRGWGSLHR